MEKVSVVTQSEQEEVGEVEAQPGGLPGLIATYLENQQIAAQRRALAPALTGIYTVVVLCIGFGLGSL